MTLRTLIPLFALSVSTVSLTLPLVGCDGLTKSKKKKDKDEDEDEDDDKDDGESGTKSRGDVERSSGDDGSEAGERPERDRRPRGRDASAVDLIEEMRDDYCDCQSLSCVERVGAKWEDVDVDEMDMADVSPSEQQRLAEAMGEMMGCVYAASMAGE